MASWSWKLKKEFWANSLIWTRYSSSLSLVSGWCLALATDIYWLMKIFHKFQRNQQATFICQRKIKTISNLVLVQSLKADETLELFCRYKSNSRIESNCYFLACHGFLRKLKMLKKLWIFYQQPGLIFRV